MPDSTLNRPRVYLRSILPSPRSVQLRRAWKAMRFSPSSLLGEISRYETERALRERLCTRTTDVFPRSPPFRESSTPALPRPKCMSPEAERHRSWTAVHSCSWAAEGRASDYSQVALYSSPGRKTAHSSWVRLRFTRRHVNSIQVVALMSVRTNVPPPDEYNADPSGLNARP